METERLDHVALWTTDRDGIADVLTDRLGLHVIERTDAFTLVGADARRGKLTLFAADGPREPGALKHVALRVGDLARVDPALREAELADGLRIALVERPGCVDYELDHVALYSREPEGTAEKYVSLGFQPAEPRDGGVPRVQAGGAYVEFHRGDPDDSGRPLLNHLAILVGSAEDRLTEARELGVEIADFVDAANTRALFVWGPEGVKIEYVEHKPSFSLV